MPIADLPMNSPYRKHGNQLAPIDFRVSQSDEEMPAGNCLSEKQHVVELAAGDSATLRTLEKTLKVMHSLLKNSTRNAMPTALKLRSWENPLLVYLVAFASRSPTNRKVVVFMLLENIETGSGFLSVNRAKQALKSIAKNAGTADLACDLRSEVSENRFVAAQLLGWSKKDGAILPLLRAYLDGREDAILIGAVLKAHYRNQLHFYINRYMPESKGKFDGII